MNRVTSLPVGYCYFALEKGSSALRKDLVDLFIEIIDSKQSMGKLAHRAVAHSSCRQIFLKVFSTKVYVLLRCNT